MSESDQHLARAGALALLNGVLEDRVSLADLLARRSGPLTSLPPQDRARAQRLATETLRYLRTCDQMLGPFLRLAPRPYVHNALRLATYEILATGQAAHGVVNAAVDLVRRADPTSKAPSLVNAVLRKVALTDQSRWAAALPSAFPKAFRKPLVAAWGGKAVAAMEAAQSTTPPLDVTPKDPAELETLAAALNGTVLPGGSLRLQAGQQVSALHGYENGDWWIQDVAAALPVRLLAPGPGERVLDMCAAPGGKTLQIAAGGASVAALDISKERMARVAENLSRTGLHAECVVQDALAYEPETQFDAILLDAPCSASGTVRRHPDLPYHRDLSDLSEVTKLQAALIDKAVALLRPGGRLVFATCSLMPAEGEDQVEAAMVRHPELDRLSFADELHRFGLPEASLTPQGTLRLRPDYWPDLGGMDGFFIAGFTKPT